MGFHPWVSDRIHPFFSSRPDLRFLRDLTLAHESEAPPSSLWREHPRTTRAVSDIWNTGLGDAKKKNLGYISRWLCSLKIWGVRVATETMQINQG